MKEIEIRSATEVRHRIADAVLEPALVRERIGTIHLRPRQVAAAARLTRLIDANRGAMLAEPVGLGKTFTALAVAARAAAPVFVVAPSALVGMWERALSDCAIDASIVTHESLSRGRRFDAESGFVIVDEAHRFRNPGTTRYARLAAACARSRLLLLTATPVQNRRADLASQLALFVGRRVWEMSEPELAGYIVRGREDDSPGLPRLVGPRPIHLSAADDAPSRIMALPESVPARGETVADVLLRYGLVHQWTSSRAALVAALRRRRTRGLAMLAALDAGRLPSRDELSAWTHLDDAMQLAFPEMIATAPAPASSESGDLALALDRQLAAIDALLHYCRCSPDPDAERAAALLRIRAEHPGERIIAFCHYAETVDALRRRLSAVPGVATLTARGARIASGRIGRDEVIAQFTPGHAGVRTPAAARIDLLVATDLLSEGLNLQQASVIVHLDLPWNPARLDQRVGRVRRLGSRHAEVHVYSIAPPAEAEELLRIDERLRAKLRLASHTVGVAGRILPSIIPHGVSPGAPSIASPSLAERATLNRNLLCRWIDDDDAIRDDLLAFVAVAAVNSDRSGFIAVVSDGDTRRIVAGMDDRVDDADEHVALAIAAANGPDSPVDPALLDRAFARLTRQLEAHRGAVAVDFRAAAAARSRRSALARVAQTVARIPRHRRAQLAPLADAARAVALAPLGEGAERVLDMLVRAELPDEAWLRSLATFGELNVRPSPSAVTPSTETITAILLLQPPPA